MPSATVTTRELKNVRSGIDLSIPDFKVLSGTFSAYMEFHIVAVSDLSCFKTAKHKEEDVVQFMIKKHLEDFESLRKQFLLTYAGTIFPPLPKKSLSSLLGDLHTKENVLQLEKFLAFLASEPHFVLQPYMLQFLGVDPLTAAATTPRQRTVALKKGADIFEEGRRQADDKPDTSTTVGLFEPEDKEGVDEDKGLFDDLVNEQTQLRSTSLTHSKDDDLDLAEGDGLDLEDQKHKVKNYTPRMFEEQDFGGAIRADDSLFLPPGSTMATEPSLMVEDNDDLLNIDEDLDDILKFSKVQSKPIVTKPALPCKPAVSKPAAKTDAKTLPKPGLPPKPGQKPSLTAKPTIANRPATIDARLATVVSTANKTVSEPLPPINVDTGDILQYIEENINKKDDELDLFS